MASLPPNPMLTALEALVGEWLLEVPRFPGPGGQATIEWLEGGAWLRVHAVAPEPAPTASWIIGRDDAGAAYTALYYDSRGVSRVYHMSFSEGVWTLWREVPGFWQRFSGTFSKDGRSIRGAWQRSSDGASWELDFDLNYTRVG